MGQVDAQCEKKPSFDGVQKDIALSIPWSFQPNNNYHVKTKMWYTHKKIPYSHCLWIKTYYFYGGKVCDT